MNNEFVTYKKALELKELGFDEPCIAWYVSEAHGLELGHVVKSDLFRDGLLAPLKQQVFRWFRNKHAIKPQLTTTYDEWDFYIPTSQYNEIPIRESSVYWTYEEAESACIDTLIELIKNK